jgi:hypothetical protein
MRRVVALLAALALTASLVSASAAAGPTSRVNSFVGNFDLVDLNGNLVGRVVATFGEPSASHLVPGSLDVTWAWYDPEGPAPFPFMDLDWPPVRESHAQLLGSWFMAESGTEAGDIVIAGASGYLCDYTAPWNAGCRPFWVQFQTHTVGPAHYVLWGLGTQDAGDPNSVTAEFLAEGGAFVLTYSGPTGS